MTDIPMNDMLETRVKQEIYVDFGSPPGEPIKVTCESEADFIYNCY